MDRRSFLSGFGAGMACAAGLLLVLTGYSGDAVQSSEDVEASAPLSQTEEQTVAQAVAENVQSPESPVPPSSTASPEPVAPASPPAATQTPAPSASSAPEPTSAPEAVASPAKPEVKQATEELVTFTVQRGMSGTQVANMLVNAGVLSSPEPFLSMLRKQDKLGKIRVGTYRAPRQSDPAEIIRLLTTPPSR